MFAKLQFAAHIWCIGSTIVCLLAGDYVAAAVCAFNAYLTA
jgi:hypothetical protein